MVRNIFGRIKPSWIDSKPDVVIAFANDHLANGRPRVYLDFLTGMVDRHDGPGEWYKEWIGCRDWSVQGNPVVAEKLLSGMAQRGIRMFGQGENLQFDDNISTPTVWTDLDTLGTTLVPIMHNVTVPPLPGPAECYRVGQAVRQFVEQDLPEDTRVALLATGGMSHERGGARHFFIDEKVDRWFSDLLIEGNHEKILREVTIERLEAVGAGGTAELLSWLVVMGAAGDAQCENLGYTAYENWKSGVGGALWHVAA